MTTRKINVGEIFYIPSLNNEKWEVVDANDDLVELACGSLWAIETPARLLDKSGSWVSADSLTDS